MEMKMKMYETFFQEVKRATTSFINRKAKVDREVGRLAVQVSNDKDDSLNKKMEFHRKKYEDYKKQILSKYSSRVKNQARK